MSVTAFTAPVPLVQSSWPLKCVTPCRCRQLLFNRRYCQAVITASVNRETEIEALETRLRSLDAPSAADLAYVAFTTHAIPTTWEHLLDVLSQTGITGRTLSRIASRLGVTTLFSLSPDIIPDIMEYLSGKLLLTDAQRSRIIAHRPDLLRCSLPNLKQSTDALLTYLKPRDLKHVTLRWPGILLIPALSITRVTKFLSSRPCFLSVENIRCLLRRAPWILVYDIDRNMAPAVHWLRDELLPFSSAPLAKFLLASPQLLGTSRTELNNVMKFLREEISLDVPTSVAAVRHFPPLLTCSIEIMLRPAAEFMSHDIGLTSRQVIKVVRAFPAVLTLDVDGEMKKVVDYFRNRGISNVARLITRLPPLLGYDLETDIIPKTEYVERVLGLSAFDILRFPAYYSYDLSNRIEPRTRFMQYIGVRVAQVGLNVALTLTDLAFCERVGTSLETYNRFKEAYTRRQRRKGGASFETSTFEKSKDDHKSTTRSNANGSGNELIDDRIDSAAWNEEMDTSRRRKKKFRATLTRMPWAQMGEK